MSKKNIIDLPKGGIIVDTKIGAIQLGVPPETIKDSLELNREVPVIYVAPKDLFSFRRMASLIDIEFPAYYNFFVAKKKIAILCTENQKEVITGVMEESFFGPKELNLEFEYCGGNNNPFFPDLKKEMSFFSKHPFEDRQTALEDLISFVIIPENKKFNYNDVYFFIDTESDILRIEDGENSYNLPYNIDYQIIKQNKKTQNVFLPPPFGITTLGSSHGFDPKGKTSGFIFWINGSGIMVDPPIDSSLWLLEENVDPRMIDSVILTHCHADHDSGVMQKILQEGRITLYTTSTVFSSFVKKTALLTTLSQTDIVSLIDFIPVTIGKPININGATLTFSYRLHSIPTIGFEIFFKNKTVVYTSDHLNDKIFFDKLHNEKILTDGRYEELSNFSWNKDIIIHEAGVPPLHTPLETLLNLKDEVKKNIYLVHTDKSKLPENSGLTISPTGLANTMVIDVPLSIHGESVQILNLVSGLDIFEDLHFAKAGEFLSIIKYRKFKIGDCLIKEGEPGNRFFIIIAGKARLIERGIEKTVLSSGSYFGETAIILNKMTTTTVIATTELITLSIEKEDFMMFVSNTIIYEKLKKLGLVRELGSFYAIERNDIFNDMSIIQKNNLESLLEYCKAKEGEVIITENKPLEFAIIWKSGNAAIKDKNKEYRDIREGEYVGSPKYLLREKNPEKSLVAKGDCAFFSIKWDTILNFFQKNPKLLIMFKDKEDFS